MELNLSCIGATPMLPNLRPGDTLTIARVGSDILITICATPLMLHAILAALQDGALDGPADVPAHELAADVMALLALHLKAV